MPNVLPIDNLKPYTDILKTCRTGSPIFLTEKGKGRYVVMDITDYEKDFAEKKLFQELQTAESNPAWLTLTEVKDTLEI